MTDRVTTSEHEGTEELWSSIVKDWDSLFVCLNCGAHNYYFRSICENCEIQTEMRSDV